MNDLPILASAPVPPRAEVALHIWAFPGDPGDVRTARDWLVALLRDHGWSAATIEAAKLMLSELASNVVVHVSTPFSVTVWVDSVATVTVIDNGTDGEPHVHGDSWADGRGLRIVRRMARSWGIDRHDGGNRVWFQVDRDRAGRTDPPQRDGDARSPPADRAQED